MATDGEKGMSPMLTTGSGIDLLLLPECMLPNPSFLSVLNTDNMHPLAESHIDADSEISSAEEGVSILSHDDDFEDTGDRDSFDYDQQGHEEQAPRYAQALPCRGLESAPTRLISTTTRTRNERLIRRKTVPKRQTDPNLVTWESATDPQNPHNWPQHRKWISTVLIAAFAFIAPMASTIVAPALQDIADEFDIARNSAEEFLIMSVFLLAFAIGPFLWGPLSEVFGRVRIMQGANMVFLLFNTVCGFSKTKHQMMTFRFLSGIGGSASQAIGGGIVSDCFRADERGTAVAIYSLMPFISPAIAPIIGGYATQYATWRWAFWATSIFNLFIQIACFFLLKETFAPVILGQKAAMLRKQTDNLKLHTRWQGPEHTTKKLVMKSLVRPFIMLTTQPALQAMALYRAYQYGLMYLVFSTFNIVFQRSYNQSVSRASLNYLSLGVGFVTGLQFSKSLQDKIYKWCKAQQIDPTASLFRQRTWTKLLALRHLSSPEDTNALTGTPYGPKRTATNKSFGHDHTKALPEYRLPLLVPFSLFIPIGLLWYGWSAGRTHWIVPNMGCIIFAMGLIVCFNCAQAYVIDTYTTYSASATGAAAFLRTMAGFSFPLFAPRMYDRLGVGMGNTVLAIVALTLGIAAPILLWRFGGWLRSKSTYCTD